jgi:arylsulfatase A-like enzyme
MRACYYFIFILSLMTVRTAYSQQGKSGLPNIVYILADDLGYGDVSVYNHDGKINTPNVDRLAREGMRFTDAHTTSSVCTPSRYSILTGVYPWRSRLPVGVLRGYSRTLIDEGQPTVASMLKASGYRTGVVGKWHLGLDWVPKAAYKDSISPAYNRDRLYGIREEMEPGQIDFTQQTSGGPATQGFDYSYILPASLDMPPYCYLENDRLTELPTDSTPGNKLASGYTGPFWRAGKKAPGFDFYQVVPRFADKAIGFIRRAGKGGGPFFLYFPMPAPHTPWMPASGFVGKSGAGQYGDYVQEVDVMVGRVLHVLDSMGLSKNTMVVFASDNGPYWRQNFVEEFHHKAAGEYRGMKGDVWEGGHRVPFIVRWPGRVKAGSVSGATITLGCLMATCRDIVGNHSAAYEAKDSYSIYGVLEGKTTTVPDQPAVVNISSKGVFDVRVGPWKLIEGLGSGGFTVPAMVKPKAGEAPGQLYNLADDPHEDNNLYASHPEKVKELSGMLEKIKAADKRMVVSVGSRAGRGGPLVDLRGDGPAGQGASKTLNIVALGAKGDGVTKNTSIIQAAIDSAGRMGGGTVLFPKGRFLSGTLELKSNVHLYLQQGAVLLGSVNPADYHGGGFVIADGVHNISITGKGMIDGQGRRVALFLDSLFYIGQLDSSHYNLRRKRPEGRPSNFNIMKCRDVLVRGITIKDATGWVQTYTLCDGLTLDSIRVESDAYWNNDGIDVVDCKKVRITHSYINSADDGICLKSQNGRENWNEDVYIADCTVRSSASAIKFGTASYGGFKKVTIRNIKVFDTFRSALALESVDGGDLEDIDVDGIVATNTGDGIFIKLGHRNKDAHIGSLRHIRIRNVRVDIPYDRPDKNYDLRGPELAFFHNPFPCSITGLPGHVVEDVVLENITINFPGHGNDGLAILPVYRLKDVPEQEKEYPEFSMFGELPSWGFYVRHVTGLTMRNVTIGAKAWDFRPAMVCDDVQSLRLEGLTIGKVNDRSPLVFRNVRDETISKVTDAGFKGALIQKVD